MIVLYACLYDRCQHLHSSFLQHLQVFDADVAVKALFFSTTVFSALTEYNTILKATLLNAERTDFKLHIEKNTNSTTTRRKEKFSTSYKITGVTPALPLSLQRPFAHCDKTKLRCMTASFSGLCIVVSNMHMMSLNVMCR